MNSLPRLIGLFLRDMLHRRYIYLVIIPTILFGLYLAVYFLALDEKEQEEINPALMSQALNELADQSRSIMVFLAFFAAATAAPASRKNGTLQFVLSLGASRMKLALAQLIALSIFLFSFVFVLQVGFFITGFGADYLSLLELATGWILLWPVIILAGLPIFALSLTRNAAESLGLYLGVNYLALALHAMGHFLGKDFPAWAKPPLENILLLFPDYSQFIFWPHFPDAERIGVRLGDHPSLMATHLLLVTAFWVILGLFFYHRHNFGTRPETK